MRHGLIAFIILAGSAHAQKTVSSDPVFFAAVQNLSVGKFAAAETGFRSVAESEPGRLRGYLGVTQVYMAQKKTGQALGYLRVEAEQTPERADFHAVIGDTAVRAGEYDLAISEFQTALTLADAAELDVPRGAPGGTLLTPAAEADPLAQSLAVLLVKDTTPKGVVGLHVRLAETYRLKLDHPASVAEWQKAAELLPQTGWIFANLGLEQEADGKTAQAIKTYRQTLTLSAGNAVVLNNLAFLLAETGGDLYEARRFVRQAGNIIIGSPDIMDTEAWIALKQGFFDDAIGTFVRVVKKDPGRPVFRKHLSLALTGQGQHSPAIDELIKALNAPVVAGDDQKILALLGDIGK